MKKSNKIQTTIIAGLLGVVFAGAALAQNAPTSPSKVSLLQALSIAKQNTNAEPIAAEYEMEMGQSFYEINLINDKGEEVVTIINASSSEVVLSRVNGNKGHDDDDTDDVLENVAWLAGVKNGSIKTLSDVIETAEKEQDATVFEAEFEDDHGFIKKQMVYELALVDAKGKTHHLDVSAK